MAKKRKKKKTASLSKIEKSNSEQCSSASESGGTSSITKNNSNKEYRKIIFSAVMFLAAIAGIWAVSGYTIRDIINAPKPLKVYIGDINLEEGDDCDVIFMLRHTGDKYPRLVALPIFLENPTKRTAKNVEMLIKFLSPSLMVLPENLSLGKKLGLHAGISRVTSKISGVSTSAWTLPHIKSKNRSFLLDQMFWLKDISDVDTPLTITISVDADGYPETVHTIRLWSALTVGEKKDGGVVAISKKIDKANRKLLVWYDEHQLMKAKEGFESPFWASKSLLDVKYKQLSPSE